MSLAASAMPVRAAVATAAPADEGSPSTVTSEPQQLDPNQVAVCSYLEEKCEPWAPPPLLNLDQQVFFASPAQRESLRKLEKQAVANVINDHGLTDADIIAVQTWGRNEALAELYLLLTLAMIGAIMIARKRIVQTGDLPEEIALAESPRDVELPVRLGPAPEIEDNPHAIPVVGTKNPRQKVYPEN